ncbi:MAG: hypothetical protein M3O35_17520 [Acidobacteriota bacterium]|nr:hypothetical protein [Acidobacteriota bacterium]
MIRRLLVIALALVIVIGLLAPRLSADRFRPRIEKALEASLGRPVHIGEVHLSLFAGPGFTLDNVLIDDDPRFGIEPFAHVDSITARIKLSSLLSGRLEFANLRLISSGSTSFNFVKTDASGWNIQPFIERASRPSVPDIQISSGRLNFKFGATKSAFYISNADLDIYPSQKGDIVIRFSGAPARTDRTAQGFGLLTGRGSLHPSSGADRLNMFVEMERTSLSELITLFDARDIGVNGFVTARAKLAGPLEKLDITGDVNLSEIHRWDMTPVKGGGWTLKLGGLLDLRGHDLSVETVAVDNKKPPVQVKFRLSDYLGDARWAASLVLHELPALSTLELGRNLGVQLPPDIQVGGAINGVLGYSQTDGLQGELALDKAALKSARSGSLEFGEAHLRVAKNRLDLEPVEVRTDNGQTAEIEARYAMDNGELGVKIATRQMNLAELHSGAGRLLASSALPLMDSLRQGSWRGWLEFQRKDGEAASWSGEYELQNVLADVPGLAAPLRITSAAVQVDAGQVHIVRLRGHAGEMSVEGEYRYQAGAQRAHRMKLTIPEADLAELERLFLPSLTRQEGFLARTFRFRRASPPAWLENRRIEGLLTVKNLRHGDTSLGEFRARLSWNGSAVRFSNVELAHQDMEAAGKILLDLGGAAPAWRLSGHFAGVDYRGGKLDFDGDLATAGLGLDLLLNAHGEGTFNARSVQLGPDADLREIAGSYRLKTGRLQLWNLQALQGPDTLTGQGASQADGRLVLDLESGRRQIHLTGTLLPLHN